MAAKKKAAGQAEAAPKHVGGRPSKFDDSMIDQAQKLAEAGKIDPEIAEELGVDRATINRWKRSNPEFCAALNAGKAVANENVKLSLYQRAMGYSHPDVHISNFQGEITVTQITKHYPPDTTACIFFLKNRMPEEWRDKVESDIRITGEIIVEIGGDEA